MVQHSSSLFHAENLHNTEQQIPATEWNMHHHIHHHHLPEVNKPYL